MTELQMGLIGLERPRRGGRGGLQQMAECASAQAGERAQGQPPDVLLEGSAPEPRPGWPSRAANPPKPPFPGARAALEYDPVLADARVEPVLRYEAEPEILESTPEPSEPAVTDESMPPGAGD